MTEQPLTEEQQSHRHQPSRQTLTVLGCGNSAGVPAAGNYWGKCDPNEPRNRRTRPSAVIRSATTTVIIDTGPEFRTQINAAGIERVDAVLFTHAHGDHTHGIDDLRPLRLRHKTVIDIWSDKTTIAELEDRFAYMFTERENGLYPRVLTSHIVEPGVALTIGDLTIIPFEQDHGTRQSLGFRIGDTAYSTDVIRFDEKALSILKGIKNWVVDAAGYKMPANYVHMTLGDVFAVNKIVQAQHVFLTHMSSSMDYQTVAAELPDGYAPAYDGLVIDIAPS
jgi:phosphoribosyl 1,2-cyclic phosphate phosphodiesterase